MSKIIISIVHVRNVNKYLKNLPFIHSIVLSARCMHQFGPVHTSICCSISVRRKSNWIYTKYYKMLFWEYFSYFRFLGDKKKPGFSSFEIIFAHICANISQMKKCQVIFKKQFLNSVLLILNRQICNLIFRNNYLPCPLNPSCHWYLEKINLGLLFHCKLYGSK